MKKKKVNFVAFWLLIIILSFILFFQISCSIIFNDSFINKNQDIANKKSEININKNSKENQNFSLDDTNKINSESKDNENDFNKNSSDELKNSDTDQYKLYENENFNDEGFTVVNIIDGDTVELKNKMRLRLIGINTPESDMYFYEEAKKFMEILVKDKQVKLERDVTNKDIYGRYLRYVYLPNLFVNLEMVKCGFANAYTCPPDIKYTQLFLEAERNAREHEIGLWQKSPTEVLQVNLNYDAQGKDNENLNGEWVSIKNIGTKDISLNGWTLKDAGTNIYKFKNIIIKPQQTIFLYTGFGKNTNTKFYWNLNTPVWNNDHDTLYLRDNKGLLVYIYNY